MTPQLWYLSFVNPAAGKWAGAAFVYGANVSDAARDAWKHGCNPGGEVAGQMVPADLAAKLPPDFVHRLLTMDDMRRLSVVEPEFGPPVKVGDVNYDN